MPGVLLHSGHHNITFFQTIYIHMVIGVLDNLGPQTTQTAQSFPSGQCMCKSPYGPTWAFHIR